MSRTAYTSLADKFRAYFDPGVRHKGAGYFHDEAVRSIKGDGDRIAAVVQGNEKYGVGILADIKRGRLTATCTCPYYLGTDLCKHIWAVLLTADELKALRVGLGHHFKGIYSAEDFEDGEWNELDEEDDAEAEAETYVDRRDSKRQTSKQSAPAKPSAPIVAPPPATPKPPPIPNWQQTLSAAMEQQRAGRAHRANLAWPAGRKIVYIIDLHETSTGYGLALELAYQKEKKQQLTGEPRRLMIKQRQIDTLPDPTDREILASLSGAQDAMYRWGYGYNRYYGDNDRDLPQRVYLSFRQSNQLLPLIAGTGRCFLRAGGAQTDALYRINWDAGEPWSLGVKIEPDKKKNYEVTGWLTRGDSQISLTDPLVTMDCGLMFLPHCAARFDAHGAEGLLGVLRANQKLTVPAGDGVRLMEMLAQTHQVPLLSVPDELRFEKCDGVPKFRLRVLKPRDNYGESRITGAWEFDYDGRVVAPHEPLAAIVNSEQRRMIVRDENTERAAEATLRELGFKDLPKYLQGEQPTLEIVPKRFPHAVAQLMSRGWRVDAEGKLYRQPGEVKIDISSGIDWFELHGSASFGDQTIDLPELLKALQRGESMVTLGDGTFGVLPQEWLSKYGGLASLGEATDGHLRFKPTQVAFLDALLAAMPQATCDLVFSAVRDQLRRFDGVRPADAPPQFKGELRPYQREGLGWLHFLRAFRFGGCLADDMGLGKTIQVLAMLEARRIEKEAARAGSEANPHAVAVAPRPSLIVLPKSLVFNWTQEAAKFTPNLRVLNHTGQQRLGMGEDKSLDAFNDHDLILTTYGTLRNDAALLKDVPFDYAILDEAQAIKNAGTGGAKAVRLLQAQHRLVMTGTPVENHLGDLWSLFEFLNPGMLGSAKVFSMFGGGKTADPASRELLGKALRPFILRRKKEQVARDLPAKVEQTIYCELEAPQRKLYNDLRDHYRQSLLGLVDSKGMNHAKIQVLEALLRLRQAACHPGLIDKSKSDHDSAKLDALIPQVQEIIEEGHKTLVFSQFTSLLAIVKQKMDEAKITYEYLDGQTSDRRACVERFQNDDNCKVFLISLKAGGVGLNLTAADYVFLLDPWWNPAVEAQAIDRAHRIGQRNKVFAYRLIAKDTVEEKVLELQATKRELADAIISQDNSVLASLGREELELLLS